jgi:hypothetical protein
MEKLKGEERVKEFMGEAREKNREYGDGSYKPNAKFIAEELVKAHNECKVVYCRFGK